MRGKEQYWATCYYYEIKPVTAYDIIIIYTVM